MLVKGCAHSGGLMKRRKYLPVDWKGLWPCQSVHCTCSSSRPRFSSDASEILSSKLVGSSGRHFPSPRRCLHSAQ